MSNKNNDKKTNSIEKSFRLNIDEAKKTPEYFEAQIKNLNETLLKDRIIYETQIKNLNETLLRVRADFENSKKRSAKELNEFKKFSTELIIIDMIEVGDNFELAIDFAKKTNSSESIVKGLEMVFKRFFSILESNGLEKISLSKGDEFDPNIHNAIGQIESCEHKDNTIVEILKSGYRLHSKVIRPASVIVAKNLDSK